MMHTSFDSAAHLRPLLRLCARLLICLLQLAADHIRTRLVGKYPQEKQQQPREPTHVADGTGVNLRMVDRSVVVRMTWSLKWLRHPSLAIGKVLASSLPRV